MMISNNEIKYGFQSIIILFSSLFAVILISFGLLFFILKIDGNKGFNVYLPSSDSYIFKDMEKRPDLLLTIDANANIFINNSESSGDELIAKIDLLTNGDKESNIRIQIDKSLRYGDVINLINFLKYNEYKNLIFITN